METERLQVVDIVNKIFGESGWSFSISNVAVDYIDDNRSGNYSAGASAVVRVQRSNGVFREDIGFGSNWGSNKADVISKAKKDAVTDGLKGAVINFGGDMAQQLNTVTPKKTGIENARASSGLRGPSTSAQSTALALPNAQSANSSPQASVKPNSVPKSLGENTRGNTSENVQATAPATKTSPYIKPDPSQYFPSKKNPQVPPTSPLAVPLPQHPQHPHGSSASKPGLSEEELARIERKKRQQQLQEEFKKKYLIEQAQAQSKSQSKSQDRGVSSTAQQSSREPLKEQKHALNQPLANSRDTKQNGLLDADDEVMLSTQDMEAISAIAANTTNILRHSPILSSPSIARPQDTDIEKSKFTRPSGMKRPDLNSYAFNPEKRQRNEQSRH